MAERISTELDEHCVNIYDEGFRWHLGASIIGDDCKRKLWYGFRWCGKKTSDGRMYRLFNRGHIEETRWPEWLRGMGFTVWTHDENAPLKADGTRPQFRIQNKCNGHFGGSLDGIVQFPDRYNVEPKYALFSCKTSGTGAGFNKVKSEPLLLAKPEHYIQESIYGESYGIEHVLYACTNKNDDDIALKVEKLDFQLAKNMEVKAQAIIFSQTPPQRLYENPTAFKCKSLCEFKDICHFGKPPERNCRSCFNCSAIDGAEFFCGKYNVQIPREEAPKGCPDWLSITAQPEAVERDKQATITAYAPEAPKALPPKAKSLGLNEDTGHFDFEIENVPLP